jgi:hypothetical protein
LILVVVFGFSIGGFFILICIVSILGSVRERVGLAKEPRVVTQVQTFVRVVDFPGVVNGALHDFAPYLALGKDFLKIVLRDIVAISNHLKAVLVFNNPLDVKALDGIAFKALHDNTVNHRVDRILWAVQLKLQDILLGLFDRRAFEGVHFGDQIVQTAS